MIMDRFMNGREDSRQCEDGGEVCNGCQDQQHSSSIDSAATPDVLEVEDSFNDSRVWLANSHIASTPLDPNREYFTA